MGTEISRFIDPLHRISGGGGLERRLSPKDSRGHGAEGGKEKRGSISLCVVLSSWFCFHCGLSSLNSCYNLAVRAETHLQTKLQQSEIHLGKQTLPSDPGSSGDG